MNFQKMMGARILSELNDLKRTPEAAAKELGFESSFVQGIVDGTGGKEDALRLIYKMGEMYPIDISDLMLVEDDCTHGVRIMRAAESEASKRIFERVDRTGARTPYYDYRDTAMSKLGAFKPEWIKELRVVSGADPDNPDVSYNNGHFMHQMTFHVGPVNFYYEVNGKKYCKEFNTGDSNYITPFFRHSFASRDKDKEALIIAVTFGGDVRRAQKEFYALGKRGAYNYTLPYRESGKAVANLIAQHLRNENMTTENLKERAEAKYPSLNVDGLLGGTEKNPEDIAKVAELLNIEPMDLHVPVYKPEEEVVTKVRSEADSYFYPNSGVRTYKIYPLARSSKMPLMKGFDIQVLGKETSLAHGFDTSLHSYVYNYGETDISLEWEYDGATFNQTLHPGDSMYMQPFIKHSFANPSGGDARLLVVRVSGAINLSAQRELSYFSDAKRVAHETQKWFN